VTATSTSIAVITAALTNGAAIQAQFYGGTPPSLSALTPTLYLAAGATVPWPVQALVLNGGEPWAGQQVTWQSATGIVAPTGSATTTATGTATTTLTVGPLGEGQTAASPACLSGTTTCANFSAFGSRPDLATLTAVSGTTQSIPVTATPASVALRVLDVDGNPMAGGTVIFSQALYAWSPPCPPHGRCAQAQLLATQSTTLTSSLDGTVTLTPLTSPGVATNLQGLAATGNEGTLKFSIELHP